jgi:hypothetical protein
MAVLLGHEPPPLSAVASPNFRRQPTCTAICGDAGPADLPRDKVGTPGYTRDASNRLLASKTNSKLAPKSGCHDPRSNGKISLCAMQQNCRTGKNDLFQLQSAPLSNLRGGKSRFSAKTTSQVCDEATPVGRGNKSRFDAARPGAKTATATRTPPSSLSEPMSTTLLLR